MHSRQYAKYKFIKVLLVAMQENDKKLHAVRGNIIIH